MVLEYLQSPTYLGLLLPLGFILITSEHRLLWIILTILTIATLNKLVLFYSERKERQQIFDRGNVPSVDNKSPISGNFFEIFKSKNSMQVIRQYHNKLGKTFGIFYGPDPWYLTMEEEVLQKVFIDDSNKHIDTNDFRIPVIPEINKSLVQLRGYEWRRVRRALNPSFSHHQLKTDNVFRDLEDACIKFDKYIQAHPSSADADSSKIIDVLHSFRKFSSETISKLAFGRENNLAIGGRDKLLDAFDEVAKSLSSPLIVMSIFFDSARHLFSYLARFTAVHQNLAYIISVMKEVVKERRRVINDPSATKDMRKMVDTMIEAVDSKQIDVETLQANLYFIFFAGFETTSNTLSLMFWLLAWHPEVQDKLREAIREGGEEATYLTWVIQETLRLYPTVLGSGRILTEDVTTSKGQTLYKGSGIIACIYSIHHSEEYWGSDVELFRPERFKATTIKPTHYFAFGKGPRACLGKNLAMAELRAISTRLLLRYQIKICATTQANIEWTAPNMIAMFIEDPINLRFLELNESKA